MTNRIALGLALLILAFLATDVLAYGWGLSLFLAGKTADLVEYIAFWR